jgi:hypothetical protein
MKLYLDDERPSPPGWTQCHTAHEAIQLLETRFVTHLSLDHDLGPPEAGTGYDVCLWIEERVHTTSYSPPIVTIHSANPVGRQKMKAALRNVIKP